MESVERFFNDQSSLSSVPTEFNEHEAEQVAEGYQPINNKDRTKDMLSNFLRFLPAEGRTTLADFIVKTGNNRKTLHALGQHLKTAILIPMRARSTSPSLSPSPFDDNEEAVEEVAAEMDQPGSRKDQAHLKQLCLQRDNHRCMATGVVDENAADLAAPNEVTANTDLCHIIPFSLGKWEKQQDHVISQIWAALRKIFPQIRLGPGELNDPKNLMTLWSYAHKAFGAFALSFEPTGEPNQYNVLLLGHSVLRPLLPAPQGGLNGPRLVIFERHGGDEAFELPSPALLLMHSALAKILHASGMARYLDELVRDGDEIGCLAPGGGTNLKDLLTSR